MIVHFLGTTTAREDLDRLSKEDRFPHTAANELQWSYVKALRCAGLSGLRLFSTGAISEYPRAPKLLVSQRALGLRDGDGIRFIPYLNLMGLKQLTQLFTVTGTMAGPVRDSRMAEQCILIYSLQSPFLATALLLRRLFGARVVVIIPDLPEFMNPTRGELRPRAMLKAVDSRLQRAMLRQVDGAIVLTETVAEDCLPPHVPYIVIDSIREVTDFDQAIAPAPADPGRRIILYSGVLAAEYGVGRLLQAVQSIEEPGYELWFTGKGNLEERIREASLRDPRIRSIGYVPLSELRRLQAQASLLVSVKPTSERYSRYTFPSKITEYMASGRPVASTVSPAIAAEYFDYVHRLADDSPAAMKQSILEIFRIPLDERLARARRGREFLARTRSAEARGRELASFLATLVKRPTTRA